MPPAPSQPSLNFKRRLLLFLGSIVLLYPFLRFIGYTVKKKPRIIEIQPLLNVNGFYSHQEFILFEGQDGPWAISRKCTHLGCTVNYHENDSIIECPCHQSRFSRQGKVLHGPAQRPLPLFPVVKNSDSGTYQVTIT